MSKGMKILLFLVFILITFHSVWYAASRIIPNKQIPSEEIIKEYQTTFLKRLNINVDMSKVEESYLNSNGYKLHLDIINYQTGKPTIVLIPGTSVYAQIYIEFMYAMHEKGFNVVGFDPRGHGRSSGKRGDYTINEIVDDSLAVANFAKKRFKSKVALAGSSQGGIIAFYAASRDDSISAAVCHNIADLNGKDNLELSGIRLSEGFASIAGQLLGFYKNYFIPISLYVDLSKEFLKDGTDAASYVNQDPLCVTWISLRALKSLLKTELAKPVPEIKVPIMLIHAENDHIFPQKYVENIFNKFTCKKKFLLLKDRDHLVMTNDVDEIIGPVSSWLKTIMQ